MNSTLKVETLIPSEVIVDPLTSSTALCLKQENIQFQAESGTYNSASTNQISINLYSANAFINFKESFLIFKMYTSGAAGSNTVNAFKDGRCLSVGGSHSLFNRVSLSTNSGVVIHDIQNYNLIHAISTSMLSRRENVEMGLVDQGDSLSGRRYFSYNEAPVVKDLTYSQTQAAYTAASQVLKLGSSAADCPAGQISYGDTLEFGKYINATGAQTSFAGRVVAFSGPNFVSLTGAASMLPSADIAATGLSGVVCRRSVNSYVPARQKVCEGTDASTAVELACKLDLPLFNMDKLYPLFLQKSGLVLNLYLENPNICMEQNRPIEIAASEPALNFTLSNVRFNASIHTFSEQVVQQYLALYKSDTGISYPLLCPSIKTTQIPYDATSFSGQFFIGSRSLLYVSAVLQYTRISVDRDDCSACNDSLATWPRSYMNSYQWQLGNILEPSYIVNCDTMSNANLALMKAMWMGTRDALFQPRWTPNEYQSVNTLRLSASATPNTAVVKTDESKAFIFGADFSRSHDDVLDGIDASSNPLQVALTFSQAEATNSFNRRMVVLAFCGSVLNISERNGTIVRT